MNRRINTYNNHGFTLVESLLTLTPGSILIAAVLPDAGARKTVTYQSTGRAPGSTT
jgi:competence protein ComGC